VAPARDRGAVPRPHGHQHRLLQRRELRQRDRLDYTIIGGEANLAARLQPSAAPGEILLSFETYALVRDQIRAQPLSPIRVKGISREIVPYVVEGWAGDLANQSVQIRERTEGLDLFVDVDASDTLAAERARRRLSEALAVLDAKGRRAVA
jgi:adenylate cyclase